MPMYEYRALSAEDRLMTGCLEATDSDRARETLISMGLGVQAVTEVRQQGPAKPLPRQEFLLFNQQLAGLVEAGIPLDQGLREVARDVNSRRLKGTLSSIADDLSAGRTVDEAFARREKQFPPLYARLVRAGVHTGRLSEMLLSLNRHLESSSRTRRIVLEAVSYPLIVALIAAVVGTVALRLVAPVWKDAFTNEYMQMPQMVRLQVQLAEYLPWVWLALGVTAAAMMAVWWLIGRWRYGKQVRERMTANLPVIGAIWRWSTMTRLTDAVGLAISSGSDLPQALRSGGDASGSLLVQRECDRLAEAVESGQPLETALADIDMLPTSMLMVIQTGSRRDQLADHLHALGETCRMHVVAAQATLNVVLFPVMVILVAILAAGFVIGLFLPLRSALYL